MGKRPGPTPEPIQLGLNRGSRRAKDKAKIAPMPKLAAPPCPEWMPKRSRKHWQTICDMGMATNVISNVDNIAVGMLCSCLQDWLDFCDECADGPIREDGTMTQKYNYKIAAQKVLLDLLREFGFTPASRSVLKTVPNQEKVSPLAQLIETMNSGVKSKAG